MSMARAPERLPQTAPQRATPAPDLRLVGAPGVGRRAGRLILTLAVVGMFAALLLSAVFHSVLVSGQQRLDRLDSRVQTAQAELAEARLRLAERSSPERIVAAAQKQGMVRPDHITWLTTPPPTTTPARATPPSTSSPAKPTPPASSTPAPAPSAPGASASGRQRASAGVGSSGGATATAPGGSGRRTDASPTTGTTTRSGPTR